jgi:signal transduction histidine kinase
VRRFPLVAIMVALVGAVLAVSLWTMHRAGGEALSELRDGQTQLAQETASALREYLESFDRDTRLLAALARGEEVQAIDAGRQDDAVRAAFQALATVVPHYRSITLVRPGQRSIVAVDPAEDGARVAPALRAASEALAARAAAGKAAYDGPLTVGAGRSFYLYAVAAGEGEAVVVTADAEVMLEAVSRRPAGSRGLVVVDGGGVVWIGCEQRQRCRMLAPRTAENSELRAAVEAGSRGDRVTQDPGLERLGLPARVVVGEAAPLSSALGAWSVAVVAPATDIDLRQRAFLRHLVMTSIAVATAMLTVGLFILRQHATAAALGARLQAAEQVAALQRQLVRAEKLVTVGVLSAGIAHEIGTPLAVVRGRAEHMLERARDARDAEDLRAVIAQIDRVSSTIRQVLDFSRDRSVEVGEADARAAVGRATELLEWRLAGKRITVDVDAPADLPPLAAAGDQLEQVVLNLLMNACDASPPGSAVRVSVARDAARADRLRIEIADHGVGIPPEHLNAVFDPYFTTKTRGEGTGLGLAMVAQIVRSHRGEIALRSTVGVGTVAVLSWPVAGAQAAALTTDGEHG